MAADLGIYVILDGSGSMGDVKKEVVTGINEFIDEQKAESKAANDVTEFTLTSFDTNINEVYVREDVDFVNHVSIKDTFLGGGTALLDAIGRTLTSAEDDAALRNIVVIYTDGEENSSREYTKDQIEELIKRLDETGRWQFIYLGAEFAAFETAADYGSAAMASAGTYASLNTSKQKVNSTFKNLSTHTNYTRSSSAADYGSMMDSGDVLASSAAATGVNWDDAVDLKPTQVVEPPTGDPGDETNE